MTESKSVRNKCETGDGTILDNEEGKMFTSIAMGSEVNIGTIAASWKLIRRHLESRQGYGLVEKLFAHHVNRDVRVENEKLKAACEPSKPCELDDCERCSQD